MNNYSINQETCVKCGICSDICPANVIEKRNEISFKSDYTSICLKCGQCMAVCRTQSIFVEGLSYNNDFFPFPETNDFFSLVSSRRSVRRFKEKPVPKEEIEKILFSISQSPHGDSHIHTEITVVSGREKIMEILPEMSNFFDKLQGWLKNPLMRAIIKHRKGKSTLNTLMNHLLPRIEKGIYKKIFFEYDGISRGAHTIILFHAHADSEEHFEDAFIGVTYAALAAHDLGLGATINGLIPAAINKTPKLKEKLKIPSENEVTTSLILGYPKYKYHRAIKRELKKITWLE